MTDADVVGEHTSVRYRFQEVFHCGASPWPEMMHWQADIP